MMPGIDPKEFLSFLLTKVKPSHFPDIPSQKLPAYLECAIDADLHYMLQNKVLNPDGTGGDNEYDEDDAFEEIVHAVETRFHLDDEAAIAAAELINEYMDWQEEYLTQKGLLTWE